MQNYLLSLSSPQAVPRQQYTVLLLALRPHSVMTAGFMLQRACAGAGVTSIPGAFSPKSYGCSFGLSCAVIVAYIAAVAALEISKRDHSTEVGLNTRLSMSMKSRLWSMIGCVRRASHCRTKPQVVRIKRAETTEGAQN